MNNLLTPEQLAAIKVLVDAATPGPWDARLIYSILRNDHKSSADHSHLFDSEEECENARGPQRSYNVDSGDPAFVAAARTDIPALLAHIEAQAAEIERLHKTHDDALRESDAAYTRGYGMATEIERLRFDKEIKRLTETERERDRLWAIVTQMQAKLAEVKGQLMAARVEVRNLRGGIKVATEMFESMRDERDAARTRADAAVAMLRRLEWEGEPDYSVCPCCRGDEPGGHEPDCELAALINATANPL